MRRSVVVAGALLVLAAVFLGFMLLMATPTLDRVGHEPVEDPEMHSLEGYESGFWPFINARPAFEPASSINVIVRASAEEVTTALTEQAQWNRTRANQTDADPGTIRPFEENATEPGPIWGEAAGGARYAFVHDGDEGEWVRETVQLHVGTYFGERLHLRLYESPVPEEPWVAIQVHSEHFDWFTLRHAVDGIEEPQSALEADFMEQLGDENVVRVFLNNQGPADADGWATLVNLAVVAPFLAATGTVGSRAWARLDPADQRRLLAVWERVTPRTVGLAILIAGLFFGVRLGGIALENLTPIPSKVIAGSLYPFLAFGIPLGTYVIAHGIHRRIDAGMTAGLALGAAMMVDYSVLGVDVLSMGLILQRFGVVFALALFAAGAAERATRKHHLNTLVLTGAGLWVALLGATVLGWM